MANIDFYKQYFGLTSTEQILEHILKTSLETNYTAHFFVNWEKVNKNKEKYQVEFSLLQSIHRSSNPKVDFRKLIGRYPEVIKVIPCTLALRDSSIKLIELLGSEVKYQTLCFDKKNYTPIELDNLVDFVED
jgi:hypothetical protein